MWSSEPEKSEGEGERGWKRRKGREKDKKGEGRKERTKEGGEKCGTGEKTGREKGL